MVLVMAQPQLISDEFMIKKICALLCLVSFLANAGENLEVKAKNSIFVLLAGAENYIERALQIDPKSSPGREYVGVAAGFDKEDGEDTLDFLNRMTFTFVAGSTPSQKEIRRNKIQGEIVDALCVDLLKRRSEQIFTHAVLDAFNAQSRIDYENSTNNS